MESRFRLSSISETEEIMKLRQENLGEAGGASNAKEIKHSKFKN